MRKLAIWILGAAWLLALGIQVGEARADLRYVADQVQDLKVAVKDLQASQVSWLRSLIDERH